MIDDDGTRARVVCGRFWGKKGPVDGIAADPIYIDVSVPPGQAEDAARRDRLATRSRTSSPAAESSATPRPRSPCRRKGVGWLDTTPPQAAENRSLILFDRGDEVVVQAGDEGIRFLLVSGKPLKEPVAWYGPIVMNTQEQLQQAYEELQEGTFLKGEK